MLADFDRLLASARTGEPHACRLIFDDLARPVAGYLRARGARDVEDLTSDVFLAVFTGLDRFVGGQPEFRSWVFTIAHRRMVDDHRRRVRTPWLEEYEPGSDDRVSPSAEDGALERLGTLEVERLLALLTDEQREVLTLRVVGDLTVEQVAAIMGKQPGAIKALQRRGLEAIRRAMAVEGAGR